MAREIYVTADAIVKQFDTEIIYKSEDLSKIKITASDVNRPGLQIVDFFDYFDNKRIQILGKVEFTYMKSLTSEQRLYSMRALFSRDIPLLVITRGQEVFPEILEAAKEYETPILRVNESTSKFMASLIAFLSVELASRVTIHGVLCEVYGEGILITGESGVGKSEIAIELVKRGHRLVADDSVEIKKVSNISLVGSAPETIRHFIEIRGIGIVDVKRLFGMGAIKETEKIDLVINLELWDSEKQYDRVGLDAQYTEILGLALPSLTVPVRPGRNLAVVVEVAAMNNRQRKLGYNAAEELNNRLIAKMTKELQEREALEREKELGENN